jgi:pilus assembly protein Flp/PilA
MKNLVARFANDESGATAIEYGLIAACIALVMIAAMPALTAALNGVFARISNRLDNAT